VELLAKMDNQVLQEQVVPLEQQEQQELLAKMDNQVLQEQVVPLEQQEQQELLAKMDNQVPLEQQEQQNPNLLHRLIKLRNQQHQN
jgi:hypothetical protein